MRTFHSLAPYVLFALFSIARLGGLVFAQDQSSTHLLSTLQTKMVKIYGAGGVQGLDSFQSGFLVSEQGLVLTAWSTVLDVDSVRVVTWDGRKWEANIVGVDPSTELALLQLPEAQLAFFDLNSEEGASSIAEVGDRVFGISNLFNIATGNEENSVQKGQVVAIAPLAAQRGSHKTPYRGNALVIDVMTNNPGAAGGALVNLEGQLVGILGKEFADSESGIWLNYALPAEVVAKSIKDIQEGKTQSAVLDDIKRSQRPHLLAALGIRLVPDVVEKTPAYIDQVKSGSMADTAGLQANDLVLVINDKRVDSCKLVQRLVESIDRADAIRFLVQRDGDLYTIEIRP